MWRIMSVHCNNTHVNERRWDGRITVADLIGLGLRDKVDIMTGDWNQAGWYLEECTYWTVRYYEQKHGLTPGSVKWAIPGATFEIRTIFFNWSREGTDFDMFVNDMANFRNLANEDYGLRPNDCDTHLPQFFMVRKHIRHTTRSKHHHLPTYHHTNVHFPTAHSTHVPNKAEQTTEHASSKRDQPKDKRQPSKETKGPEAL